MRLLMFYFACAFVFLRGEENSQQPAKENKGSPLTGEDVLISQEASEVEDFYALENGAMWREVTQEILASDNTPEASKIAIQKNDRRIFVFKYPSDGLWIKGFISFTPDPIYHPLLVLYRWGNEEFALMNPGVPLATYKNYTVISSTLRGGVSEGNDEFGGKDVDDMKNLIQFLPHISKELQIRLEPSCVFMLGPSRGGMEMFLTLAHFPELQKRVNKIVALSAILDMNQLIKDRPYDMKIMLQQEFGLQNGLKGQEWIRARDPVEAVRSLSTHIPVLIVQGTKDNRIGLNQGHRMASLLRDSGHDVSYWEIKGGNHVLTNDPLIMTDIAQWLESDSPCMCMRVPASSQSHSD